MNVHDRDVILSTVVGTSILYVGLSVVLSNKQIPLLFCVFIVGNMISRLRSFEKLMGRFKPTGQIPALRPGSDANSRFLQLHHSEQQEMLSAIKSLQLYSTNSKKMNDRRRKLFRMMTWRQQNLCKQVGYLDKLGMIDLLVERNQRFFNKIIGHAIGGYQISFSDFDKIKSFADNNSYRVIESLTHFNRDWNMDVEGTDWELGPVLDYIQRNLEAITPASTKSRTCIVVPGSGLGRIPYELSLLNYKEVHSIEFSGLMFLFNQFVYENADCDVQDLEVFPYVHTNSNFKEVLDQHRSILVPQLSRPSNLHMHLEDFNTFELPKSTDECDTIVVVTAFFLDTAENLMDYLDSINSLCKPFKKAYWINIGPLKYGTAPKVELNMQELAELRSIIGWKDLDSINTLETPIHPGDTGLYGYATDKSSLWQGFYGLNGWCSEKIKK